MSYGFFRACRSACRALFVHWVAVLAFVAAGGPSQARNISQRNVVIFVADGLRADSVTPKDALTLWRVQQQGVNFTNPHALYPTLTTVNASAIATGHYIGDTGNFGNQLYTGFASPAAGGTRIPFLEDDAVLGEMNAQFGGNYLNEESLLSLARRAGFQTAAIGKTGAAAIQDVTARDGASTIVIDGSTGTPHGIPVSAEIAAAMKRTGLTSPPPRSSLPNSAQEDYLLDITAKILLPKFKAAKKPFMIVFWCRDPDYSQHSEKDSFGSLTPGINGSGGKSGIRDADRILRGLLAALHFLSLEKSTDVVVTADHGFATVDKHSETSAAARYAKASEAPSTNEAAASGGGAEALPAGFLAIDLADALRLPLFDGSGKPIEYQRGERPAFGSGLIGQTASAPEMIVAANGGSDEIWLPGENASGLAQIIARVLSREDYVSGIFVNDRLGEVPGALPFSAINLQGASLTPAPSIIVGFRSGVVPGCRPVLLCSTEAADSSLETGQGMHGSFSRADTKNFMAAVGPDFRSHFADPAPVSNADIAPTLAHLLRLSAAPKGHLPGRVLTEALRGGSPVTVTHGWLASKPAANGLKTVLDYQQVGGTRYFDAAGYPGRTVGLLRP